MPNDTDIFGAASPVVRDEDIFKDLPASKEEATERAPVATAKPIVEPNELQRRMGISKNRYKDENLLGNIGHGFMTMGEDAGREATLLATGLGASPNVANVAGFAGDVGSALLPTGVGSTLGHVASPIFDWAGKFLMRSALKPSAALPKEKAAQAVKTLLDEGINVTEGGVDKAKGVIRKIDEKVSSDIANSGATVSTRDVADYVPSAYDRFKNGPLAVSAIEDLGAVQREFLEHPNVLGARDIPVQVAQDMKRGYQTAIGDKGYDKLRLPSTEGEKQIARGLREKIGEAVPSVVDPLAREANLIRALKLAEHRVAVDANKNPIGLGALISQPWMFPIWMWDRSPLGKSMAARALYSGQQAIPSSMGMLGAGALYEGLQDRGALYTP